MPYPQLPSSSESAKSSLNCKVPDQLTNMCFCKVEKPKRDKELVISNRPRHRLSCSLISTSGRNIALISSRLQPHGAAQSSSCTRSPPTALIFGEGSLPRELRRETQPLFLAR